VGPYNNPSETYAYYSLPFCTDGKTKLTKQKLGETLSGDRKVQANLYVINFGVPVEWRSVCAKVLSRKDIAAFQDAIDDKFYFEMFIDGLPLWGYLGKAEGEGIRLSPIRQFEDPRVFLYPHLAFTIGYNKDQVVSVNVEMDPTKRVDITELDQRAEVLFSYSVQWVPESLEYSKRMTRYVDSRFLPSSFEIHWLSIINSVVLVLLLTAFLTVIMMRVLKNDFSRYLDVDEEDVGEEETGWKLIHGDVFRHPKQVNLFSALMGSGAHLGCTTMLLLLCAVTSVFKVTRRGSILTTIIMLYCLTASVGGFVAARLYRQLGGTKWVLNSITTSLVFPIPLFLVFTFANSVAWHYGSTARLPFFTITAITCLWVVLAFPLTVIGSIVGRNTSRLFQAPCRTTKVPREIPKDIPWYHRSPTQMFMSGFLPFSAIYIELHYIFASVWGHQIYTLFGILILAFCLLLVVCSFITVALTYFQLTREDHQWWWRSFLYGGSTGFFIYVYSFFYFFQRSSMDGLLQGAYYFGYMAIMSYAFFCMLGFVGFYSSLAFVRYIYSVLKCD
ncbi:unnamed protein product, partial [Chrysoparadoxa australica]